MALVVQLSKMIGCFNLGIPILFVTIPAALGLSYNCNYCNVSSIPPTVPIKATELHLVGNRIRSISQSSLTALTDITLLDMSRNSLAYVEFGSFSGLMIIKLVLSYNQISDVPHIEPLANTLTSLDLSANLISTIKPFTFNNFTVLSMLHLTSNSITTLPDFAFHAPFARFYQVFINANRLNMLSKLAFAGMSAQYLILNNNELTEFPCLNNITFVRYLHLRDNPIRIVPHGCGQWWKHLHHIYLARTRLTSVDNITKFTPRLNRMEVYGASLTVSDETFKHTPYLSWLVMRDLNQFPMFYSNKATLWHVDLGGRAIQCIDEPLLDGMNAVLYFRLWDTSIVQLPHPGCSGSAYENSTTKGYFHSLRTLMVYSSHLEKLPSIHNVYQLEHLYLQYNRIATIDDADIPELNNLNLWQIYRDKLTNFPNLTSLGFNSSLATIDFRENKILAIPCFSYGFKMHHLVYIYLNRNRIDYICNMDFAPNVKAVYLEGNPLSGIAFLESTNVPLLNLHNVTIQSNNIDIMSDSALRVVPNCWLLQMEENKIKQFPAIKLIASTIAHVQLHTNLIPDVPCAALDLLEALVTLYLDDNLISYVCPMLLALAPKLTHLGLSGNRLLEIADLRTPARTQPTTVVLTNNPFKCLSALCWMLFVPPQGNLQLELKNTLCLDSEDMRRDITPGLTAECTCESLNYCIYRFFAMRSPFYGKYIIQNA